MRVLVGPFSTTWVFFTSSAIYKINAILCGLKMYWQVRAERELVLKHIRWERPWRRRCENQVCAGVQPVNGDSKN